MQFSRVVADLVRDRVARPAAQLLGKFGETDAEGMKRGVDELRKAMRRTEEADLDGRRKILGAGIGTGDAQPPFMAADLKGKRRALDAGAGARKEVESAEALSATNRDSQRPARKATDFEQHRAVGNYHDAAATAPSTAARVMYHYTSREGLASILESGKLRPSSRPGRHRGQYLTSIRPGTLPDIELTDRIGMSANLSHYLALDVSRLHAKTVHLDDAVYLIRNRRSLDIRRLLVDWGENPVVPLT